MVNGLLIVNNTSPSLSLELNMSKSELLISGMDPACSADTLSQFAPAIHTIAPDEEILLEPYSLLMLSIVH